MHTWLWNESALLCRQKAGREDGLRWQPRSPGFPAATRTRPVGLLSLTVPSLGRSRSGLHNRQESHSAGEVAGAGSAPALPESRDQAGRSTDRRAPSENTGRGGQGWAGAGGLPAWGLSAWARPRLPTQPGSAPLSLHGEEAQVLPWPIRPEAFVSCECLTPDPWSQARTGPGS